MKNKTNIKKLLPPGAVATLIVLLACMSSPTEGLAVKIAGSDTISTFQPPEFSPTEEPAAPAMAGILTGGVVKTPEGEDYILKPGDKMPSFKGGGMNRFQKWVFGKLIFPEDALSDGATGVVMICFIVEKTGEVTNIEILDSPHEAMSEEVMKVVEKSPKWKPGIQQNQPVRVKITMPVSFEFGIQ